MTETKRNLSLAQLRPFLEIAIPFFREDRAAFCSLVGIVSLTLLESALLILFSYTRRDIFDALNNKQEEEFFRYIMYFFLVLVMIVPTAVLYQYLLKKLALYWRKELTKRVLDKYYANRTYYIVECCKDIDNPDQRICEDLTEFTSTSLDFFFVVFDAIINLLSFSAVLYNIYPMLFLAIIGYAAFGTLCTAQLGNTLVGQYYAKLQREADFRFGLIRTRENAEGIAFYDSEAKLEQINLWKLFERVIQNQLGIIRTQRNLEMFTTSYDYLVFVIPYLVVSPLYFRGEIDLGSITQASEAFYYVRSDFSIIVSNFEKLSAFSAGIDRLSTFIRRINEGGWKPLHSSTMDTQDKNVVNTGSAAATAGTSTDSLMTSHSSTESSLSKAFTATVKSLSPKSLTSTGDGYAMIDSESGHGMGVDNRHLNHHLSSSHAVYATMGKIQMHSSSSLNDGVHGISNNDCTTYTSSSVDIPSAGASSTTGHRTVLQCQNLSVLTPDSFRTLIGDIQIDENSVGKAGGNFHTNATALNTPTGVNFEIFEGDKVLVTGPSGTGKSSLLRAISGLWELGSGHIVWNTGKKYITNSVSGRESSANSIVSPSNSHTHSSSNSPDGVFFLPQKPYNLLGSLRQQIGIHLDVALIYTYPSVIPSDFTTIDDLDAVDGNDDDISNVHGGHHRSGNNTTPSLVSLVPLPLPTLEFTPSTIIGDIKSLSRETVGLDMSLDNHNNHSNSSSPDADGHLDMELLDILRRVRLETLASRMGSGDERAGLRAYKDWSKVLSLGEQQRLAFARLLYNHKLGRVSVAVLDEATSALDEVSEAVMYGMLDDIGLTYISVGHRSSLYKFHSKRLNLLGPGLAIECMPI